MNYPPPTSSSTKKQIILYLYIPWMFHSDKKEISVMCPWQETQTFVITFSFGNFFIAFAFLSLSLSLYLFCLFIRVSEKNLLCIVRFLIWFYFLFFQCKNIQNTIEICIVIITWQYSHSLYNNNKCSNNNCIEWYLDCNN